MIRHPSLCKTYVLNLDRHPERLAEIGRQLDAQDIDWQRFSAIDSLSAQTEVLDQFTDDKGPIPRMGAGARACTVGHFLMWKEFLTTGVRVAFILEDDARISSKFKAFMSEAVNLADNLDILNFNRQSPRHKEKKLFVAKRSSYQRDLFTADRLLGPHFGTAGYMITRETAIHLIEDITRTNVPIDHLLFNPNVSEFCRKSRIYQTFPAMVKPSPEIFATSIQKEKVPNARSWPNRLRRGYYEVNQAPRLFAGLVAGQVKVKTLEFLS